MVVYGQYFTRLNFSLKIQWLGSSGIFVSATSGESSATQTVAGRVLTLALYAWDRRTFYGTITPSGLTELEGGITLSVREAIRLMESLPINPAITWKFQPTEDHLQTIATKLAADLSHGRFVPDVRALRRGQLRYRSLDEDDIRWPRLTATLLTQALKEHASDSPQLWAEFLRQEDLVRTLAQADDADIWSEAQWFTRLGLSEDRRPYRWALRLAEPAGADEWPLEFLLVDWTDHQIVATLPLGSTKWQWEHDVSWDRELALRAWDEQERRRLHHWLPYLEEPQKTGLTRDQAWEFLDQVSPRLIEAGYRLYLPAWWEQLGKRGARLMARVKSPPSQSVVGLDAMIQFDWRLALGDSDLSLEEFERLAAVERGLIYLHDRWMLWDPAWLERARVVIGQVAKKKGISFQDVLEHGLLMVDEDDDLTAIDSGSSPSGSFDIVMDEQLETWVRQLEGAQSIAPEPLPNTFEGILRPYQQHGLSWLRFIRRFGLGGILADDMGLGKTIQYIAYLAACRQENPEAPPALLVVPTSVLGNWDQELKRFAPRLQVYIHYGADRVRDGGFFDRIRNVDVVVTSYAVALMDGELLASPSWDSLCLDEAQQIKNAYSKRATRLRAIRAQHRLALTGTPIENRLADLWSIMGFVNPGYLGSLTTFNRRFANPIERQNDPDAKERLQRLIAPFVLRRVKNDPKIALDLPEKSERKVFIALTREQAAIYEALVQRMLEMIDQVPPIQRRGIILATLTRLKQVCDHPGLVQAEETSATLGEGRSTKLIRLNEMVTELRQEGDQCLIFTQFVKAGELIQEHLQASLGERVAFLHGGLSASARDRLIQDFQTPDSALGVFVLSLRAGGVGLNLTEAQHVFHFDRWWNPAVESQATDRAHRIGQTRHVQVHKFITLGTVEERIDLMLERKGALSRDIIDTGEEWITELSTPELKSLFMLRRSWLDE
ncbi:MAG: DEAD/DEAH box helicase [Firmicutes bacterium]|nr:DEAD/DEAH box helicase [Bacillota bacterium]